MRGWDEADAVKAWKQLKGVRSVDARSKEYIRDRVNSGKLDGMPWEPLRAAMKAYAETVKDRPLPVAPFWSDPSKWMRDLPSDALEASGGCPTIGEGPADAPRPASASQRPIPQGDGIQVPDLIQRWNALCPSSPATSEIARTVEWANCRTLPGLVEAWDEVAARAQSVRESASDAGWLSLPFLLRTKAGMAKANWQRLLTGDFDPRERRGGRDGDVRSAINEWLEAIDAVEREWLSRAAESVDAVADRRKILVQNQKMREAQEAAYQEEVKRRQSQTLSRYREQYVQSVVAYGHANASLTRMFANDAEAQAMIEQRIEAMGRPAAGQRVQ